MKRNILGRTGIEVTELCFGILPIGPLQANVERSQAIQVMRACMEAGINFFDTADTYGLGESEKTLGEALGKKRKQAIVATKFGVRVENGITSYYNSKNWVNKAVNNSLKRLNTDYIDL